MGAAAPEKPVRANASANTRIHIPHLAKHELRNAKLALIEEHQFSESAKVRSQVKVL